jgi:hypothetical protein
VKKYHIEWIGPPRRQGPVVIHRETVVEPEDDWVREHAEPMHGAARKLNASAMRVFDDRGHQVLF